MSWPSIDHSILSPSGHTSKRARKAALARESKKLFPDGMPAPQCAQPSERVSLLRQADELDALAARGMKSRAYHKRAAELRSQAEAL